MAYAECYLHLFAIGTQFMLIMWAYLNFTSFNLVPQPFTDMSPRVIMYLISVQHIQRMVLTCRAGKTHIEIMTGSNHKERKKCNKGTRTESEVNTELR